EAVREVVRKQADAGIDIVSDGEMSKVGFANYVKDRMTGFGGADKPFLAQDLLEYPETAGAVGQMPGVPHMRTPACTGPITYTGQSLEEFRAYLRHQVDAINRATQDIPTERIRLHVCWGNYPGTHHRDRELKDFIDLVVQVRAGAFTFEAANPRHAHEWKVWKDVDLPRDTILIPGVIDTCTNYIEHPEVVAERIARFASIVGPQNVIASTDCGFGTFVGVSAVAPRVAYAKLDALAQGAAIASKQLFQLVAAG